MKADGISHRGTISDECEARDYPCEDALRIVDSSRCAYPTERLSNNRPCRAIQRDWELQLPWLFCPYYTVYSVEYDLELSPVCAVRQHAGDSAERNAIEIG